MPRLTCITTTFNDGPALLTSVRSVLNQSFEDFQYIIVDDGSAAETREILDGLQDDRLLVIRQANDGLSGARNKALEQVRGDYVCFLDADDARPNWAFAAIADLIADQAPDVILTRGALCDLRGEILPFYDTHVFHRIEAMIGAAPADLADPQAVMVRRLAQLIEPQSANKVVRRELVGRGRAHFPNTHFFEDIQFHTAVLSAAERVSFLHQPAFTYFRRYQRPQITGSSSDMRFDIIPVTRLTLDAFSRTAQFRDPLWRGAVLASCFRILIWCGDVISHHYRDGFEQAARALLRLIHPAYLQIPDDLPEGFEPLRAAQAYIRRLSDV